MFFASPAHALEHVKISYVVPTVQYGALLVGIDQGYFKDEGIEVELVQAGGGVATPALISGDLQFSGSPSVAISADLKGAHLKAIFVGSDHSAFQLWVQPDIKNFADLKDKQVGIISRGDTTEISLRYILAKKNLPADYLSYTPLGTGTGRVAALISGTFPGALIDAGEVKDMRDAGRLTKLHLLIDMSKEVHMTFGGFATSDAMIKDHRDTVKHVVRALMKGLVMVRSSREKTIAALVKHGSTENAANEDYTINGPILSPTSVVSDEDQAFELKLRADMLGVDATKVPPPSNFFDFSFVKEAAAELKKENWQP
ncbi:MAG TPA: ABC transporter substrate-binding protein [Stellaceae bacterium]|jgi:NitT/TauT family transport system substrate-binding protein|nr:ABC transporter substrate-binding protein [Stellaceae bacterium]